MSNLDSPVLRLQGLTQSFQIHSQPYTDLDFSKLAFVFCGQGQMSPGLMAEEVNNFPIFQAHFAELDAVTEAAGIGRASDYIRKPGANREYEKLHGLLSLFALQIAMHETLVFAGHKPGILTAHSFGEFSQLTAAGVLGFRDMLAVLIERQKSLGIITDRYQMIAINDPQRLDRLSSDLPILPANFNTHRQTTFVCREEHTTAFRAHLKSQRIASTVLDIDAPYHTAWLDPARRILRARMTEMDLKFQPPKIPFISSVTGQIHSAANFSPEVGQNLICDQLTTPVHFPEQIRLIHNHGIAHFVELSPIDVLTPFIEQVLMQAKVQYKTDSFRRRVKATGPKQKSSKLKDSKILEVFNRALKTMTGYTVEDIHLEDRIREDLGIDSIKKAEIVFRMVDEIATADSETAAPVNLAELATFADVIEYLENSERARERAVATPDIRSVEFQVLVPRWRNRSSVDFSSHADPQVAHHALRDNSDLPSTPVDLVVFHSAEEFDQPEGVAIAAAKNWISRFAIQPPQADRWIFLHRGSPFEKAFASFLRTLAQEQLATFTSIENPKNRPLSDRDLWLASLDFFSSDLRIGPQNQLQTCEFAPIDKTTPPTFTPKTVLAFGGLGGVGRNCLRAWRDNPVEVLIVAGRSANDDSVSQKLTELGDCAKRIEYRSVDCANPNSVEALLQAVEGRLGPIDLILHSVGSEVSELLPRISETQVSSVLDSKLNLARVLANWADRRPEGRVVFNSSTVAQFGSVGQTVYAFANEYLNALAESRPNLLSILWPAWRDTGMANQQLNTVSFALSGMPTLAPEVGTQLFAQALSLRNGRALVFPAELAREASSWGNARAEQRGLLKPASKNRSLYALPGLTQKHLPYLTHHYVKNICPLPASGSMALMLYRGYLESGELGVLKDFSVLNFVIVDAETSPYFLEAHRNQNEDLMMQIRSNQLIVQGQVTFAESTADSQEIWRFESDRQIEIEFNQNVPILIGPLFKLEQGIFSDSASGRLIERMDLSKTPQYTGIPILDKLHKLMEFTFSALCIKAMDENGKMVLPKGVAEVRIFPKNLEGHLFYAVVDQIHYGDKTAEADLNVVNSSGKLAIAMKGYRSVFISRSRDESAKQLHATSHRERFF